MALGTLISLITLFAPTATQSPVLVQVDQGRREAPALLRRAGGTELARELGVWRVPASSLSSLRRKRLLRLSRPERLLTPAARSDAGDPLVPLEYWRSVVGADRAQPPGPGKAVTVVDSGLDVSHPEFVSRPNTLLLNSQTVRAEDEDHGTEVASVVGAPANGVGLIGVYPEAVLRSWDASPAGFLSDGSAIQGIVEAARRGPGVINLSFGGPDDNPLLEQAILFAIRRGSLVVAASGNEGIVGSPPSYPANYPHVLTVGATNQSGRVALFSTTSRALDLVAPGVRIPVAEPLFDDPSGYSDEGSGTSFSAPIVSGAAAWVWTARPDLDQTQVFEVMRRSAQDIEEPGFDRGSGFGLLDIPAALVFPAPLRDPLEPNDDADQIEPRRLFETGLPSFVTATRRSSAIAARVDRQEDPDDLYRVYVGAGRTVTAATRDAAVDLRLLPRTPRGIRAVPLATSSHRGTRAETVSYRNRARHGVLLYVDVRPGMGVASAAYQLRVTAARR